MVTLVPSILRWRVAERKPGARLTALAVARVSRSTSRCWFEGSTVKTLIRMVLLPSPIARAPSSALHAEQFDVEDQRGVRGDDAAGAACAIAERGRDDEGALAADLHRG